MLDKRHQAAFSNILSFPQSLTTKTTLNLMTQLTLIVCFGGLDVAMGSTINLRSRSYLRLWTLPSSFLWLQYPPETTLAVVRKEKQKEEAEQRSRQVGRETVQRWLEASELLLLFYWA
jgi:hypothetical protein